MGIMSEGALFYWRHSPFLSFPFPSIQNCGSLILAWLVLETNRSPSQIRVLENMSARGPFKRKSDAADSTHQDPATRRFIRSEFLKLKTLICDKRDDLMNTDSDKFDTILKDFDKLHDQVQKPREQVADAEALLDLTRTLVGSVMSMVNEGITPAEFVGGLLKQYGHSTIRDGSQNSVDWKKLDLAVSPIFMNVQGCCTMLGPMEKELKQRKAVVQRKRTNQTSARARPEEIVGTQGEENTDTDQNMKTMFDILRKIKGVQLESLILNRTSFAQTVENLFALSFLVKDGRATITLDENGSHYVSPRNAPAADSVRSKEVSYTHFMFRFDYEDWKLMKDVVPAGKELMPHRTQFCTVVGSQAEMEHVNSPPPLAVTPIRKLSRNRGLVVQEGVVEESPECDVKNASRAVAIRRCKRKLH